MEQNVPIFDPAPKNRMTAHSTLVNAITLPYVLKPDQSFLTHDFWPSHPQPHPPRLRTSTCSAFLLPASRWVGLRLLLPVAMATLCATPWPIRRPQGRTKSATRWRTSLPIPPAMRFRDWRNGHCTRCGLRPILMSGRALRAAAPGFGLKRMVRFLNHVKKKTLYLLQNFYLLANLPSCSRSLYDFLWSIKNLPTAPDIVVLFFLKI